MKYFDVVLASASPRRRELIKKLDYLSVQYCSPEVSEILIENNALLTAVTNARLKGEWAAKRYSVPIIAADTVVSLDGAVLNKPENESRAREMLKALCGATHDVITALYVSFDGRIIEKQERTAVSFGGYREKTVNDYIKSGAPFDKAGGYGIQDAPVQSLKTDVTGDYDNVIGLPVRLLDTILRELLF